MKCLILAGGFGTRLAPLTDTCAKCLLPLGRKTIIDYVVEKIPRGIDIIVSTNRKFEAQFKIWKEKLPRPIELVIEDSESDETKPGACKAIDTLIQQKEIREHLFIIGGDNFFSSYLADFVNSYNETDPLIAVYDVKDLESARRFGVVTVRDNKIVRLEEKPSNPQSSLIATACYILPPHVFHHLAEYCRLPGKRDNLGGFISYLVMNEKVVPYYLHGEWFDIGSPEVYETLTRQNCTSNMSGS